MWSPLGRRTIEGRPRGAAPYMRRCRCQVWTYVADRAVLDEPPGQHLGGHRLASLYRSVSIAPATFQQHLVQIRPCARGRSVEEVATQANAGMPASGIEVAITTAKRRSSTLYPVGPDQDPGQDAVYGTGDPTSESNASGRDQSTKAASCSQGRPRSHVHPDTPARAGAPAQSGLSRAPSGSRPAVR